MATGVVTGLGCCGFAGLSGADGKNSYWQWTRDAFLKKPNWFGFRTVNDDLKRGLVPSWVQQHFVDVFSGASPSSPWGNDTRYMGYPTKAADQNTWWICLLESGDDGVEWKKLFQAVLAYYVDPAVLAEQKVQTSALAYRAQDHSIYFLPHGQLSAFRDNPDGWAAAHPTYRLGNVPGGQDFPLDPGKPTPGPVTPTGTTDVGIPGSTYPGSGYTPGAGTSPGGGYVPGTGSTQIVPSVPGGTGWTTDYTPPPAKQSSFPIVPVVAVGGGLAVAGLVYWLIVGGKKKGPK